MSEILDYEAMDEEGPKTGDFTVGDTSYVVQFTTGRIKLYENVNRPLMAVFAMNGGTMSLEELETLVGYGLREEGGNFVNPKKGAKMAEKLIEENGYFAVYEVVINALGRDCDFLFKGM
jgi:hypothetical protein